MIEVEIIESNLPLMSDDLAEEKMSFLIFQQLSMQMDTDEELSFKIYEEGTAIYMGTYKASHQSVLDDIKETLSQLITIGDVSEEAGNQLFEKLEREVYPEKANEEKKNHSDSSRMKKETELNDSIPEEEKKDKKTISKSKKIVVIVFLSIMVSLVVLLNFKSTFFPVKEKETTSLSKKQKGSFTQLLEAGQFEDAMEKYPKKIETILDYLFEKNLIKELKKMNKSQNTDLGDFYLSFLNKEWGTVIEKKVVATTKERQSILAYAYMQTGKMEEAEIINDVLQSKTLTEQLTSAKVSQAYQAIQNGELDKARKINEEVKNEALESSISTAQIAVTLLKKYELDSSNKELSPEEQAEAKKNVEALKIQLKEIGREQLND